MGTLTVDNINVNSNITGGKINNPSFVLKKVVITMHCLVLLGQKLHLIQS